MLLATVYPIIWTILWMAFLALSAVLLLRMGISYADPNPFGAAGRFGFKLRKNTERLVYPAARFLAEYRVDPKLAPLLTILIAGVLTFVATQVLANTLFVIDGIATSIANARFGAVIGYALYAVLSILVLLILIRFLSFWFVFQKNTFFGFVVRVTDPVLLPFQRWIPKVGMFDVSAMVVLILINILQSFILRTLT